MSYFLSKIHQPYVICRFHQLSNMWSIAKSHATSKQRFIRHRYTFLFDYKLFYAIRQSQNKIPRLINVPNLIVINFEFCADLSFTILNCDFRQGISIHLRILPRSNTRDLFLCNSHSVYHRSYFSSSH